MRKYAAQGTAVNDRRRWWAVIVLCLSVLMIAVNATIVTVALPSIQLDLRFSEASLVWVVNAYLTTFAGFLLLGGRLGDLFGRRQLFLLGISFFTMASIGCGLAISPRLLVAARCAQGVGGAIVLAVALSEITSLFEETTKRAKALGLYVFVSACGGSIGLLMGGVLTSTLSWRWVFLVNVPIGVGVYVLGAALLPFDGGRSPRGRVDVGGGVTITISLMLAVYALANVNQSGWSSVKTLSLLVGAGVLLFVFVAIEARVRTPLIPLKLLQVRNLVVASIVNVFLATALLAWRFMSALYLQLVLQLSPMQVGLAFLPANLTTAVMSLVVAPTLVMRFGIRLPIVIGMLIVGIGLASLARASMSANVVIDVLPGMLLLGLGSSMTYHPLLLSALSSVPPHDSGAASGIATTSFTAGGAIGLSLLATVAAARTDNLLSSGTAFLLALNSGYQVALCIAAVLAVLGALICGVFLHDARRPHQDGEIIRPEIRKGILDDAHS